MTMILAELYMQIKNDVNLYQIQNQIFQSPPLCPQKLHSPPKLKKNAILFLQGDNITLELSFWKKRQKYW